MRRFASPTFWDAFSKLPQSVRAPADKNYTQLKENPRHPSLQLLVGPHSQRYRALAVQVEEDLL